MLRFSKLKGARRLIPPLKVSVEWVFCVDQEPKKLVRYRDNKIVSLKGERYTEVKREDGEEPTPPKKTVVNLKPARQYRSH